MRAFHRLRGCLCLAAAVLLLPFCGCASGLTEPAASLEVYFFAAGKADAILLTTENAAVLIDCGVKGFGKTIVEELEARSIERIDCLVLTHFDQDHIGGAAKLLNSVPVTEVLQSNRPRESGEYEKFCKMLEKAGLEPVTVRETLRFTFDGVEFTVEPPQKEDYRRDDSNNSSLIVTVRCGETRLLFPGDAQTERLTEYLAGEPERCELLKLPHHGEAEPLLGRLLDAVEPSCAVITCSAEEPDISAALRLFEAAGTQVFLTSEGPVRTYSDGKTLTVEYAGAG